MAYTNNWDETDPDGSIVAASDIDAEIQQVKTDVRERIEEVIPGWPDDSVEPKIMGPGTARIIVDTNANQPASPDFAGQLFYDTTNDELYVGVDASNWEVLPTGGQTWVVVDTEANMPSSPDFSGQLFYSSDTDRLWVGVGGSWEEFSGSGATSSGSGFSIYSAASPETWTNTTGSLITKFQGYGQIVDNESAVMFNFPFHAKVFDLFARFGGGPGAGNSVTYTVRKGQADTGLDVQLTDSTGTAREVSTSVEFPKDTFFSMKIELSDGISIGNHLEWRLRVQDIS